MSQENKTQVHDIVVTTSQKSCSTSFTELCWSRKTQSYAQLQGERTWTLPLYDRSVKLTSRKSLWVGRDCFLQNKQTKHCNMQRKRIKRYTNMSRCLFLIVASLAVYFFLLCFLYLFHSEYTLLLKSCFNLKNSI